MKRAKDAGIVVVAVDVAAEGADATITSDNTRAGEMACKYITDRLKGKGNVVIINGPPVSAVQNRVEGCQTEFKRHPDIKVLSDNQNAKGSREGGLEVMTGLLAANPKIDGVFAINDPTAIGADLAANRHNVTSSLLSVWTEARTPKRRSSVRTRCLSLLRRKIPSDGSESGGNWLRHFAGQTCAERAGADPGDDDR